ncbi:MAG TPA: PAS domain S-box protein [Alphaproteobacteria bacterium]|nr:PAS domain S-box protein [Alphaproteobacteria bacterium]
MWSPPRALVIGLLTLAGVLMLSIVWEFGLEALVLGTLMGKTVTETATERWEFVATSVGFAALAMAPLLLWLSLAMRRERSARRALDDSRQQFQTVVEAVSEVIWEVDTEGRYTYVSENVREALGVSSEQVLGREPLDFVAPTQRAKEARRVQAATSGLAHFQEFELECTRPDGSTIWLAISGTPVFSSSGEYTGHSGVARNISERKRADQALAASEARYRTLVETTHDLIWSVDKERRFNFINRNAALAILGYQPEEMLGRTPDAFKTPQQAAKDRRTYAAVRQGQPLVNYETVYRHKDGSYVPMMFNAVLVRDGGGNVIGTTGTVQDISERKRREELSRSRQAELAHDHRLGMMGEMATELAHELNQPLAAIMNYAHGCSRRLQHHTGTPAEVRRAIDKILDQAERADEVIRRMRGFARREQPEHQAVDLNAVIGDALVLLEIEARRFTVTIELDFAATLPPVMADAVQIQQVVLNLARNGMEAMHENDSVSRRLIISTEDIGREAPGQVQVTVRDTGGGLSGLPEGRIFEPFFTTKSEGTGLGLSLCRSIIEAHGGKLQVDGSPGPGAAFVFTLPATDEAAQ